MAGNPFTSASAPAYSMLAPDLAAQQMQLSRQQQMADLLRQQSMEPDQGTQVINGWAVKKSPFEGISKIAQALMGGYTQKSVDEKQLALAKALQGRMGGAFDSMAGGSSAPDPSTPPGPAVAPPDQSAPPGAGVTTSSVQDPSAPASAAPAAAPAPAPQPPQQMSPADRIRNQARAAYLMGNTELANKLLENISTMTNEQKNMAAMGQDPHQMGTLATAAAKKAGILELQPGTTALNLADGQERFQPKIGEGISLNNGQASAIPGYSSAAADIAGASAGAVSGAQAGNKLITVNSANGPVMLTEKQAITQAGGSQQSPQPAPGGALPDLNHMSPDQRKTLMANAAAQFGLRPGSAPGSSTTAPAPTGAPGIALKTPAQEAAELARVKLDTQPQLDMKSKEFGDMAEYGKNLNGHLSDSQALLQRIAQSREALAKFQAGGGGETRGELAKLAQAIPFMPTSVVDKIAGGDLSASQVFQKFAAQEALGTMKDALSSDTGKGSQGNRVAMQLFIKNNPNIDTDPRAIEKIFNFQTQQHNQLKAQADAYQAYKNVPGNDPTAFPNHWASEAIKRGFVSPEIKSGYAKGVATPPNIQSILDKYK